MSKTAIWVAVLLALLAVAAKGKRQELKERIFVKDSNFTLNLKHILLHGTSQLLSHKKSTAFAMDLNSPPCQAI